MANAKDQIPYTNTNNNNTAHYLKTFRALQQHKMEDSLKVGDDSSTEEMRW